ncbi:MAG: GLPGLI family protein [Muribaculaceae bacterium]|nr:GLPGLI family protein [Muribaculaceae bacterium]
MKKLLLLLILPFITLSVKAQEGVFSTDISRASVIDTARYKVTYTLRYTCHPQVAEKFDDVRTVLIGPKYTKDFSDVIFHFDSICTADIRRGADTFSNPPGSPWPYEIVLSNRKHSADIKYRLPAGMDILHYTDSVPDMKWNFVADSTLNILGYECQLAHTDFAGRHYSAWFTTEIPLPFGPYKFGGLPGLILQLQDDEQQFVWEAIDFELSTDLICIYDYENEKNCSTEEAAKTIARSFKSPIAFHLAAISGGKGKIFIVGKDGKTRDAADVEDTPIPYKPLEIK